MTSAYNNFEQILIVFIINLSCFEIQKILFKITINIKKKT